MNPPSAPQPPPPAGGGTSHPPLNIQQIGNLVRFWVHYDNSIAELNKQLKSLRDARTNYESQILQTFKAANMPHPVIQIAGGRLTVCDEKHSQPLTFKNLEAFLHQYYRQKPGTRDETTDIIRFIRQQRQTEVTPCLRRQSAARSRSAKEETPNSG